VICGKQAGSWQPSEAGRVSSHAVEGRVKSRLQNAGKTAVNDFARAARQRWIALGEELKADVAEFNSREGSADFSEGGQNQFRVSNSATGLQLTMTADFAGQRIDYDYAQVNEKTAGVPEGGILSMRQTAAGAVEFYSADERLTAEEARQVLLEPVLAPPRAA
jgi:hypothetical protein